MFDRATITLGIGHIFSSVYFTNAAVEVSELLANHVRSCVASCKIFQVHPILFRVIKLLLVLLVLSVH